MSPIKAYTNKPQVENSEQKSVILSPSRRSHPSQKVTIVLSTPPRSNQRHQAPLSSSPKRVRFSVVFIKSILIK